MSKQNKSTQVGNRIILNGTALLLLAYMLAKIVQAYIAGGAVQNNTVSHLRGFVLFAHGVSLLRFCTRIRYFFQNVNTGRNND